VRELADLGAALGLGAGHSRNFIDDLQKIVVGGTVLLNPSVGRVMGQQRITSGAFDRRESGELGQCLSGRAFTSQVEDRPFILANEVKQWSGKGHPNTKRQMRRRAAGVR
jgi:hypothetical protein